MYKRPCQPTTKFSSPRPSNTFAPSQTNMSNSDSSRASSPALVDTIVDHPEQFERQLGVRRAGPFGGGVATHERLANVARQASRIAVARQLFESTIAEASWAFATDNGSRPVSPINPDLLPNQPASQVRGEVTIDGDESPLVIASPATTPEPVPIPPRHGETPTPPPSPSAIPLPLYTRDDTPPPPPSPSVIEDVPLGPQIGVSPGEGWYPNITEDRVVLNTPIPDGDDGATLANFVRISTNHGSPRIEGTLGLGCPIHSNPLTAEPDRYPRPALTDGQLQVFRGGESYTPMINMALADDGDPSLQAEVYRYRESSKRVIRKARLVVQARQDLHRERRELYHSARRLSEANAYGRVYPRVIWDYAQSDRWSEEQRSDAVQRLLRPYNAIPLRPEGCLWCERRDHNTERCNSIRQCLYCCEWGHSERACREPHTLCGPGEICRVSREHRRYRTPCAADVRTFGP